MQKQGKVFAGIAGEHEQVFAESAAIDILVHPVGLAETPLSA